MKILYINCWCHEKNKNALFKYKSIQYDIINIHQINSVVLNHYDAVISPSEPCDVSKFPNVKFIFGPHFSIFPDEKINFIKHKNVVYIQPSDWARDVWINYNNGISCHGLNIKSLPFGVETEKFKEIKPIQERDKVFIYYKSRIHDELHFLIHFLNQKNISYKIFSYNNRYSENEYIDYLQNSKYGIWLGIHESQGFALEEALSCNVPLFVWNVTSINQEIGANYQDIPATNIPYWDNRCGDFFYDKEEIYDKFEHFLSKLDTYKPRQFILENLSMEKCEDKLIHLINNM